MMYSIKFSQNAKGYPGFSLYVSKMPDVKPPKPGSFPFYVEQNYAVDEVVLAEIEAQIALMPPYMKPHCHLTKIPVGGSGHAAALLAQQPPAPLNLPPLTLPEPDTEALAQEMQEELDEEARLEEEEEELTELSDEDLDLVVVEVNKLKSAPAADREDLVKNLVENKTFPELIKREYLSRVSSEKHVSKQIREQAADALKQLDESK